MHQNIVFGEIRHAARTSEFHRIFILALEGYRTWIDCTTYTKATNHHPANRQTFL